MALATLTQTNEGCCLVEGEMSFASVEQLLASSRSLFKPGMRLLFDMSGVNHADSAGVALLVEWLRLARGAQTDIQFRKIPAQMQDIIEVSDLDERLPIVNGEA